MTHFSLVSPKKTASLAQYSFFSQCIAVSHLQEKIWESRLRREMLAHSS